MEKKETAPERKKNKTCTRNNNQMIYFLFINIINDFKTNSKRKVYLLRKIKIRIVVDQKKETLLIHRHLVLISKYKKNLIIK